MQGRPRMNGRMNVRSVVRFFAVALVATGCSSRGASLEQLGPDQLYQRGQDAFERRKWSDAILAFNGFSLRFPTHARVAEARYRLGESYFNKKEYITAAG